MLLNDFYNSGVRDVALNLLKSYISEREQRVVVGEAQSEPTFLHCGVPQGSVLGPLLFTVYTSSLVNVLVAHRVDYHFYADDSQLYIQIDNIPDAKERLTLLMSDIKIWMARRKLKLNEGKTEIIIVRGNLRNDLKADFGMLHFENTQLVPCECAKNLGVVLDSTLSFRPHIDSVVKICNYNHTFPEYLISTLPHPRRMSRHTHRPRKRKIAPKQPLPLSPVVRLITPPPPLASPDTRLHHQ